MRHLASSSSIFSSLKFRELVSDPTSISFLLFLVRGRTFDHCEEFGFSLRTLLATFVPSVFFSFTAVPAASNSAKLSFHFRVGLASSHVSWELCPPSPPAGCCHRVFVFPYQSLLRHLSLVSVMARFRTAVVFSTLDSLFLLWNEHEAERETLCIVSELKEATSSDVGNHSSSSSSSPSEDEGSRLPLFHPSFHLFVHSPLSVLDRCH